MALWGNQDNAANSVNWGPNLVNLSSNSANKTALFGNTTQGAFENNGEPMKKAVGVFGVDPTEAMVSNGSVLSFTVVNPGSGYLANTTATVSGNATANAEADATGRITAIHVTAAGSGYTNPPSVAVGAPAAQTFSANASVTNDSDSIALSPNPYIDGDIVTYSVAAGNTALTNLVSGTQYYIVSANSTAVKLSETAGGSAIDLTKGLTETGHSLTGETATGIATISGAAGRVTPGWVVRTEGQGGRAGRVQYETLVAMRSITGDAEDTIFKDS